MTKTRVYLGVDIAKETLACFLAGESFAVRNTPQGHRQILARVRRRKGPVVQVICEATGPYGRALVGGAPPGPGARDSGQSATGARLRALPRPIGQDR